MGINQKKATASDNQLLFEHSPPPPPPPPSSPTRFTLVQVTAWKLYAHWTNAVNWSKNARRLCLEITVRIGTLVGFRVYSFFFFNFLFGKWWHWSCRQDYERPRHPRDGVRHGGSGGYRAGHDRWGSWWENMVFCNSCLHAIPERGLGLGFILVMLWVLIETAVDILRPRYLRELIFCYSVVEKLLLL